MSEAEGKGADQPWPGGGPSRNNQPVTTREVHVQDGAFIVTKTDARGIITWANDEFVRISGYTTEELIGQPHNLVRHPDMPPAAFEDLWKTVKAGKPWRGMVKNRAKNGDYYWVDANATPIEEKGQIVGFVSIRSKPTRHQIEEAKRPNLRPDAERSYERRMKREETRPCRLGPT